MKLNQLILFCAGLIQEFKNKLGSICRTLRSIISCSSCTISSLRLSCSVDILCSSSSLRCLTGKRKTMQGKGSFFFKRMPLVSVEMLPEKPQLCQQGGVLLDLVRRRLGRLLVLKPQPLNLLQDFPANRRKYTT